jgi:hypothetical protein
LRGDVFTLSTIAASLGETALSQKGFAQTFSATLKF